MVQLCLTICRHAERLRTSLSHVTCRASSDQSGSCCCCCCCCCGGDDDDDDDDGDGGGGSGGGDGVPAFCLPLEAPSEPGRHCC